MSPRLVTFFLISFSTAFVAGCATSPKDAVEAGDAKIIDGTIRGTPFQIHALVAIKNERASVSTNVFECRQGNGSLWVNGIGAIGYVRNLVASSTKPADQLFAELCRVGLPAAKQAEDTMNRRRAAMTPEERAAESRMALDVFKMYQGQQNEAERNASQERAAREIGEAIKDTKKTTTVCTSVSPGDVRCVTK